MPEPITPKQLNYMRILFNDCGYSTRKQQFDFLILRNIDVSHLDEMTKRQAQVVIEELVNRREEQRQDTEAAIDQEKDY